MGFWIADDERGVLLMLMKLERWVWRQFDSFSKVWRRGCHGFSAILFLFLGEISGEEGLNVVKREWIV